VARLRKGARLLRNPPHLPKDPPIIGGLALKEEWNRGVSDYTDNSGPASFYGVSTGTPG
jgi:hypothetical protein